MAARRPSSGLSSALLVVPADNQVRERERERGSSFPNTTFAPVAFSAAGRFVVPGIRRFRCSFNLVVVRRAPRTDGPVLH